MGNKSAKISGQFGRKIKRMFSLNDRIERVEQRLDFTNLLRLAVQSEFDLAFDSPAGLDPAIVGNGSHLLKSGT